MIERWRDVPGYEGHYQVSDHGSVRTLTSRSRYGTRQRATPKMLRPRLNVDGYPEVVLSLRNEQRRFRIHRLVLLAFVGPCPEGKEGAHLDGVRRNGRLENLVWATPAANAAHKRIHGTHAEHGAHPGARLTDEEAAEILRLYPAVQQRELARRFGVDDSIISRIISGKRWPGFSPLQSRTPTPRERQDLARRRFLDVAAAELSAVGERRAKLHRIAADAGVSRSWVHANFGNKRQVLAAVAESLAPEATPTSSNGTANPDSGDAA